MGTKVLLIIFSKYLVLFLSNIQGEIQSTEVTEVAQGEVNILLSNPHGWMLTVLEYYVKFLPYRIPRTRGKGRMEKIHHQKQLIKYFLRNQYTTYFVSGFVQSQFVSFRWFIRRYDGPFSCIDFMYSITCYYFTSC